MVEGIPPGDALPSPPQRATPARKGARCGAGAGFPRPHGPHPGHTGRGTLTARSRGRAAGGETAPDTRRPSQRWQATPPGDGPPPARRHTAPTGHAGQGDSVLPPHPHTRAHSMWVADPNSPPSGRAAGGGTVPDTRRPSQRWQANPPGDALPPPLQRATLARKCAHCGAGAGSPRPHRPHPGHTGRRTPATRPRGRTAGGGTAPGTRRPSQRWQATPPGDGPPTTPAARSCQRACKPSRDADSQRLQFEFAEFAANSFALRIRCEFGLKFLVLRIRGEFALRIRRRQQNDHACAVFSPDEKLTLNSAMQ